VARQKQYFPTLDGWRGLSVIGVILYHGRFGFFRSDSLLTRLSSHGDIGVDVFFAISGFLICRLLLNEYERDGGIHLRRFYTRRCFRILPPYYAAVAGIVALSVFGAIHVNYSDLPSCLLLYRNYRLLGVDEAGGFYTAHFWSLAIEEHFYLVWPMILIAVKPKRLGQVAFLLAMAVAGWRAFEGHFELFPTILIPSNLLARTDAKVDALVWGCIAAICFPAIKRYVEGIRVTQVWLPIVAILFVVEALHVPGLLVWQAILLPALVLSTVLQPNNVLGRFLEWQPLRWVGTISYSLYLWQEVFLPEVASEKALGAFHYFQQPPLNVLAMLLCACLSRYLLERPMIQLGQSLSTTIPGPNMPNRPTLSPHVAMRGV
jgi:peptidoglycan/LPS O-acetylase OafA/YrhL